MLSNKFMALKVLPKEVLKRTTLLELGAITLWLLLSAIPLVLFRPVDGVFGRFARNVLFPAGQGDLNYEFWMIAWIVGCWALFILWFWIRDRKRQPKIVVSQADEKRNRPNFYKTLAISLLLLVFSIVTFYIPMRQAFWSGIDEAGNLYDVNRPFLSAWSVNDIEYNRPLTELGGEIAELFTPNSVEGYLWLVVMLRVGAALLIWGILSEFLPQLRGLAFIAALLMIVNPAEPGRYLAVMLFSYYWAVFTLLLAAWLFIRSYKRGETAGLVVACGVLAISLFTLESGFLLSLFMVVLVILFLPTQRHLITWTYAWLGTMALIATRLGLFLLQSSGYQSGLIAKLNSTPTNIIESLTVHMRPMIYYFHFFSLMGVFRNYGVIVLIICIPLLWIGVGRIALSTSRKSLVLGTVLGFVAIILGIGAYFFINGDLRTLMFAAPMQAAFWTLLIGTVIAILPQRLQRAALVITIALVVAASTTYSLEDQSRVSDSSSFQREVSLFQQIHTIVPEPSPHTLILLILDDHYTAPFQFNYHLESLSRLVLDAVSYAANFTDQFQFKLTYTTQGITLPSLGAIPGESPFYKYSELIALQVRADGSVVLLKTLPANLLPGLPDSTCDCSAYQPLARIMPGNGGELRFMNYPYWMSGH